LHFASIFRKAAVVNVTHINSNGNKQKNDAADMAAVALADVCSHSCAWSPSKEEQETTTEPLDATRMFDAIRGP